MTLEDFLAKYPEKVLLLFCSYTTTRVESGIKTWQSLKHGNLVVRDQYYRDLHQFRLEAELNLGEKPL